MRDPLQSCGPPPDPCLNSVSLSPGGGGGSAPDCSPIIVDVGGNGFQLTSAADGVLFDITGSGRPIMVAWPARGAANAFLVLDRNRDGVINSGAELFGNFSPQPPSANPNGFLALAQFDDPSRGGNGDGLIDERDAVFSDLRLWIDSNHDGISQKEELFKLPELGVYSVSLEFSESRRTDAFGNVFRYKAKVNPGLPDSHSAFNPRIAYDIFLQAMP